MRSLLHHDWGAGKYGSDDAWRDRDIAELAERYPKPKRACTLEARERKHDERDDKEGTEDIDQNVDHHDLGDAPRERAPKGHDKPLRSSASRTLHEAASEADGPVYAPQPQTLPCSTKGELGLFVVKQVGSASQPLPPKGHGEEDVPKPPTHASHGTVSVDLTQSVEEAACSSSVVEPPSSASAAAAIESAASVGYIPPGVTEKQHKLIIARFSRFCSDVLHVEQSWALKATGCLLGAAPGRRPDVDQRTWRWGRGEMTEDLVILVALNSVPSALKEDDKLRKVTSVAWARAILASLSRYMKKCVAGPDGEFYATHYFAETTALAFDVEHLVRLQTSGHHRMNQVLNIAGEFLHQALGGRAGVYRALLGVPSDFALLARNADSDARKGFTHRLAELPAATQHATAQIYPIVKGSAAPHGPFFAGASPSTSAAAPEEDVVAMLKFGHAFSVTVKRLPRHASHVAALVTLAALYLAFRVAPEAKSREALCRAARALVVDEEGKVTPDLAQNAGAGVSFHLYAMCAALHRSNIDPSGKKTEDSVNHSTLELARVLFKPFAEVWLAHWKFEGREHAEKGRFISLPCHEHGMAARAGSSAAAAQTSGADAVSDDYAVEDV